MPGPFGAAADASAQVISSTGGLIASVSMTTGAALSPAFTIATATSGPSFEYILATGTLSSSSMTVAASALRLVRLTASSETFTAVSVDTGTLSPGATSAALSAAIPGAYPGRLVFTLGDPALAWNAALSLDGVNFTSPTFLASGFGGPAGPIVLNWDGVDRVSSPSRFAPPGQYHARLSAGGGASLNETLELVVPPTAGYTGNLGAAGASAFVRAVGPGAGDGAFAQASSTGYFLLTGVNSGQAYQLTVTTAATIGVLPVVLSTALAAAPATAPVVDLGNVALPAPALLSVAAILPVPAPFDEVGGFVGLGPNGAVVFSGALHFSTGAASSDDGGPLFGRAASTWSVVLAAPGPYTLVLDLPDLNLSTSVAGVTLAPGGTNVVVPFAKSANVFGWAVLASTVAGGTTVSVQATMAGAASPSVFGSVFVSSLPASVGQSSGAYALYGLSPGTWTVLASAPGFVSSAATIVVLSSADVSGPTLTLGLGGTIVGTVTVTGSSLGATQCFAGPGGAPGVCAPGTFNVPLTASLAGTLNSAPAGATLSVSATLTSATYTITGLPPGLWTLTSSLPGFSLQPAGGLVVAVAGASVSTSALALAALDARLNLTVLLTALPGGACWPAASWKTLGLEFDGADGASRTFGDATALSGPGSFETLNCSSATFFTPALPPGPVRAAALFSTTGAWAYGRALARERRDRGPDARSDGFVDRRVGQALGLGAVEHRNGGGGRAVHRLGELSIRDPLGGGRRLILSARLRATRFIGRRCAPSSFPTIRCSASRLCGGRRAARVRARPSARPPRRRRRWASRRRLIRRARSRSSPESRREPISSGFRASSTATRPTARRPSSSTRWSRSAPAASP